jgi:hypothetical protein
VSGLARRWIIKRRAIISGRYFSSSE